MIKFDLLKKVNIVLKFVIKFLLFLYIIAFFNACSHKKEFEVFHLPGEARLFNKDVRKELYSHEGFGNSAPNIGLSLSGGGVRSASFSIGVLEGLSKTKLLPNIDVISTVSGGGYAGYFYFSKLLYQSKVINKYKLSDIFNDCFSTSFYYGKYKRSNPKSHNSNYFFRKSCSNFINKRKNKDFRFQYNVSQDTSLNLKSKTSFSQVPEFIYKFSTNLISLPFYHLSNTVFDWGLNIKPLQLYYQNGIERTYGFVPENYDKFYNAEEFLGSKNHHAKDISFSELRNLIQNNRNNCIGNNCMKFPLWIINTTAGVSSAIYEWAEGRTRLSKSVFEFTPFGFGSNEYGYTREPIDNISISKAVSISGAAADAQQKATSHEWSSGSIALGLHLFNLNLGYSLSNYNKESANTFIHNILPFPFYYFHGFSRNKDSNDIYLSDGGHSENLGAYSLIIRGTKNVIIVDAEHDPNGNFEAYRLLKNSLFSEHKLDMKIPEIDNYIFAKKKKFNPYNAKQSIFKGNVTGFSKGYISDNEEENKINIVYIKSSLIKDKLKVSQCDVDSNVYPCNVTYYYLEDKKHVFPHDSTALTALKSTPQMYFAYRDLGKYLATKINMEDKKIVVKE